MDELKDVKPELIEEPQDAKDQNLRNSREDSERIPKLKRKRVEDSPMLEKVPKEESLEEPFFENPVKEEEPIGIPRGTVLSLKYTRFRDQRAESTSQECTWAPTKEEGYGAHSTLHEPKLEAPPKYTIWDQRGPSKGLDMAEVKEESLDASESGYGAHQFQILNEPKVEEHWASVKEEEEQEYAYEAYETSNYQLEEPKVEEQEEQYLPTGSLSNQDYSHSIWDQRAQPTGEEMFDMKEEQSTPHDRYGAYEPQMLQEPKLEEKSASTPDLYCCLCGVVLDSQLPHTHVALKSELLVLAVGLTLAGKLTVLRSQELMARKQSTYACQEHFREAAERIQTALNVEVLKLRRHDLTVVNRICPQVTMGKFRDLFYVFHKEHHKKKPSTTSRCEICNRDEHRTKMTSVTHKASKYLLAIADMLQKNRKPAQAVSFARGVSAKHVCLIHFQATLDVIFERLNLRSANEQPRAQDLAFLMTCVRTVWKDCKTKQFLDTVRWLAVEQRALKPLMTTTPRPRQPSKPKSTLPLFPCSLCSKNVPFVQTVRWRNTKLVLAIGACLSKLTDPSSAKEFVAGHDTKLVCKSHFNKSIPSILTYLRVVSLSESPAIKLALNLVSMVQSIWSTGSMDYGEFIGIVTEFAEEHQFDVTRKWPSQFVR